jgi:cation transport ATPase
MVVMNWWTVGKQLLGLGGSVVGGWVEGKKLEKETNIAIKRANANSAIKRAETGQEADINWNTQNTKNAQGSWKDEFWTIVLAIPLILCFIPGMDVYVKAGFEAIKNTPGWYQAAVAVAISASFGYKKYANWRMQKLSEKKE